MSGAEQTDAAASPLRGKLRLTGAGGAGPIDDRAVRVWRQTTARALKAAAGLNVQVTQFGVSQVAPDDLADVPAEGDMIALLESGQGDVGLALIGPELMVALIEVQTIGRVTDRPPLRRRATAVDAALVGPSLDRLLSAADPALAEAGLSDPVTGYRFAMLAEAGTPPTLALADLLHRRLSFDLRIEGGLRNGRMQVLIPDTGAGEDQKASNRAEWGQKIGRAVLASDLLLEARLGRLRLPVERVMSLAPGGLLPLAQEELDRVRLVAGHGGTVARARLGQANGYRAVKLLPETCSSSDLPWAQARIETVSDAGFAQDPLGNAPLAEGLDTQGPDEAGVPACGSGAARDLDPAHDGAEFQPQESPLDAGTGDPWGST